MAYVVISSGGLSINCLLFKHEWSVRCSIQLRYPTEIVPGRSDREGRRPEDEGVVATVTTHVVLQDDEAQAFRNALASIGSGWVGIPIPVDRLTGAQWSDRIYDPQAILDLDSNTIQGPSDARDDAANYAGLLIGHIVSLPAETALTDGMSECSFTLEEDSPEQFRIGVNATVSPGMWPENLIPNWAGSLPVEQIQQDLEYERVSLQREQMIGAQEKPPKWNQEADFMAMSRDDIRLLLGFFVASMGARKPFTAPLWFAPGTPSSEAPASTVVRFGADTLQMDYDTDAVGTARVKFAQLPWEIEGVEGEQPVQPARLFLYQFCYNVPVGPVYFRYTNWPRAKTIPGDGTYTPAPMMHDVINEGIDLTGEDLTLNSYMVDGNPLMMFDPYIIEAPLLLKIFEIETDPIDVTAAVQIWEGEIMDAPYKGRKITATASYLGGLFSRQFPNVLVGVTCNTFFCSSRCTLIEADYLKTGTFDSEDYCVMNIATSATDGDNAFVPGKIWMGSGLTYESRAIIASSPISGGQRLVVDWPVRQAAAGQAVTFRRHCDRTAATCKSLGNFINFRGHPNLPQVDLSLPTLEAPAGAPGKK